MWKMERPDSDRDIFEIYLADTREVLLQRETRSTQSVDGNDDIARHEVGRALHYVIDGNLNFIHGTFSPIILYGDDDFFDLRVHAHANLSRKCYFSIRGMAQHNLKHLKEEGLTEKKARTIVRLLRSGQTLLLHGEYAFLPYHDPLPGDYRSTVALIEAEMDALTAAYDASALPATPQHIVEADEWLVGLRTNELTRPAV
jgi:hypothetical protein